MTVQPAYIAQKPHQIVWAVECDQPEVILFEVEYKVTTDIVSYDVIVSTNIRPARPNRSHCQRGEKLSQSKVRNVPCRVCQSC